MYLTNCNLILVNSNKGDKKERELDGFAIKSYKVYNEEFKNPTFGAREFHGLITTYNAMFPNDLGFKIVFDQGGYISSLSTEEVNKQDAFMKDWERAKQESSDKRAKSPQKSFADLRQSVNLEDYIVSNDVVEM